MKVIIFIIFFSTATSLAQTPPIIQNNSVPGDIHGHIVHLANVDSKLKDNNISHAASSDASNSKTNTDIIDYLTSSITVDEAQAYLYDFNQVGSTDAYSDETVLAAVDYFENNVIDMLDSTLSNTIPFKFVYYFRSYEYHAWYQPSVTLSEDYIDALFAALPALYNKPEYWSSDDQVAYFRWFAAMLMDIDGHRGEMYDYVKLHMNTNSTSFLSQGNGQADGMNAVTFIIWRGLANGDSTLHQAMTADTSFLNDFMAVINNSYLIDNYEYIALNYIGLIYQLISESYNVNDLTLDIPAFEAELVVYESTTTFGTHTHMQLITQLYKATDLLESDWSEWRQIYFDWEFPDIKEYDDGEIIFNTNMSEERRNGLYLAVKEAKANFFKLMGDTNPIPTDPNDTISIYLYRSYEHYQYLSELIGGFGAVGGGVYIEEQGALYTFDRDDTTLPIEHLVKHEYVHYIDARHNIHGTFGSEFYDWQTGRYSFWNEGLAEFIASTPRSDDFYMTKYAAEVVWDGVINNSSSVMNLYQATHNPVSNGNRTYAYANAAWSFLHKHHHQDLLELIKSVRENRTDDFRTYLDSISSISSYDAQFTTHVDSIAVDFANTFNLQGQNGNDGNYYEFNPPMPDYTHPHSDVVDMSIIQQVIDSTGIISAPYTIYESYTASSWVRVEIDTVLTNVNMSAAMKAMATHINQKIDEFEDLGDLFTGFNFVNGWMDSIEQISGDIQLRIVYEFPRFGEYTAPSVLSVSEPSIAPIKITAYPNPFTDYINIINIMPKSLVMLHDIYGKKIYSDQSSEVSENHKINMSSLKKGVYFLIVKNKNRSKSFKLIKI